jgi:hypothetical protein
MKGNNLPNQGSSATPNQILYHRSTASKASKKEKSKYYDS